MRFFLFVLAAVLVLALPVRGSVAALTVRVTPSKPECFFENAPHVGAKIYLHFAVTNGAELDIDVSVTGPDGEIVWEAERSREARLLFKARAIGQHKFCFNNRMSTFTAKSVAFSMQVGDTASEEAKRDPMERSVKAIYEGLQEVQNQQNRFRVRERKLRDTAESTHEYILYWSIAVVVFIMAMSLGHVWYLRRLLDKSPSRGV